MERYRTEQRARRRCAGETLNDLFVDVKRLVALGYQAEAASSSVLDSIAKDCFIDALDTDLALRVREKEPSTLDNALHVALRLEAIHGATSSIPPDDVHRDKMARGAAAGRDESLSTTLITKLNEMQSRFEGEMKKVNHRLAQMEAAQRTADDNPPPRTWSTAGRQSGQLTQAETTTTASSKKSSDGPPPPPPPPRQGCYRSGSHLHRWRQCPVPRDKLYAGDDQPSTHAARSDDAAGHSDYFRTRGVNHPAGDDAVYLAVSVHDRAFLALLDSGSYRLNQLNIAPPSVLHGEKLIPVSQSVCR